jgi:ABC-type multidrug transport system fused ATPase/permease subunit
VLLGSLWYVATQAGAGHLRLGDVALFLAGVTQLYEQLLTLLASIGSSYQAMLSLRRLFRFLDGARPTIALASAPSSPSPTSLRSPVLCTIELEAPPILGKGVTLRQVSFRYPESARDGLQDVNAFLPAGKVTSLIGANGAGKSTLVKLLTRMYDPTAGQILFDAQPLHAYELNSLRRRIAVLYQDFARLALTLRDNIAVGASALSREDGSPERLIRAARWSGADEVAARLPAGYETELTRHYGGVDLSGGEWQKVALARAFVRDAAFVILDEPTAALGVAQTAQVLELVRRLADKGLAVVLISHNMNDVFAVADRIAALYLGRMAAQVKASEVTHSQVVELITSGRSGELGIRNGNGAAS